MHNKIDRGEIGTERISKLIADTHHLSPASTPRCSTVVSSEERCHASRKSRSSSKRAPIYSSKTLSTPLSKRADDSLSLFGSWTASGRSWAESRRQQGRSSSDNVRTSAGR